MQGPRKFVMNNAFWGKEYSTNDLKNVLSKFESEIIIKEPNNINDVVTDYLLNNRVVGWFNGKSEFGPRALGDRSILASPIDPSMRDYLNKNAKFREWFRPFGVCVIRECVSEYFDFEKDSPYMLIAPQTRDLVQKLIPSAVHIDGSCRVQTVDIHTNNKLYTLLCEFQRKSGVPMLINTSFNIKGEPIVETPEDAIKCFLSTKIT